MFRLSLRYLLKHRWQSLLMLLGIALGVGVMVSIDLANTSAMQALMLSTEALTGKATHQISASGQYLDESVYVSLRRQGVLPNASPILSALVSVREMANTPLYLLGIDPLVDFTLRENLGNQPVPVTSLYSLLVEPNTLFISHALAKRYQINIGDSLHVEIEGRVVPMRVAGILAINANADPAKEGVLLADIATVQEITGHLGQIERIDLKIDKDQEAQQIEAIQHLLPPGWQISPTAARQGAIAHLTEAFRLNLSALSLLAMVVGLFLIYNTMTFSVVQRRPLFGLLRSLGVSRKEIFALVVGEASVVGILGTSIGILLGILMAQKTIEVVTQTISDLYFVSTVRHVTLPIASLLKAGLLGISAVVATAIPPAAEASLVPPQVALNRTNLENKTRLSVRLISLLGLPLIALGILLIVLTQSLIAGFTAMFLVILGLAMLSASAFREMMRLVEKVLGRFLGFLGRMAPRSLVRALSRTGVATISLMIAIAVSIGMGLMIHSFRQTVVLWLEQSLQGDIYISVPSLSANRFFSPIDPTVLPAIKSWPGVEEVDVLRSVMVESSWGTVQLSATDNPYIGRERYFKARIGDENTLFEALKNGAVMLSEPLANRAGLKLGDTITLFTPKGRQDFPVAAIYYDYATNDGIVMMLLSVYQAYWNDPAITAIGIRVNPGVDAEAMVRDLQQHLPTNQRLLIRSNQTLRQDVLRIFDQTFAVTAALRIMATLVAFIGMISALLLLQMEKQHDLGVLKAHGISAVQIGELTLLETILMGIAAGVLAIPTGISIALILIRVINLRSFGWTIQFANDPAILINALLITLIASIIAGLLPAYRLSQISAAEAMRNE